MRKILPLVIICMVCFVLFYNPITEGQPLGLDAIGHLSKISYLKNYPLADWDMSWYSGALFLKMYAPLLYYIVAIFPNPIYAINIICFLSILFCSLGIYWYVFYLTKKRNIGLYSGLSFLTVLSLSFYYISVGNHPWIASLWALPLSLYFLERSLKENKKKHFVIYSLIFSLGIITHVLVGALIGITMIIRIGMDGINLSNFKKIIVYGIIPVLISSFWFFPFLTYRNNFFGGYEGQIPELRQLFGFHNEITWGSFSSGIGILAYIFVFSLLFFKRYCKDKVALFLLISIFIFGIIFFGGLGSHYPYGVEPVRFILPFSILLSIFIGVVFDRAKLSKYSLLTAFLVILLVSGLIWNFMIIQKNYNQFAYYREDSRYGIFQDIMQKGLPIEDKFTNYRFGTSKFVFGENLNYFYPHVSQTLGYQDAGMLNAPRYYDMRWNIWISDNINDSFYWLDWLGIKYIESEGLDSNSTKKFENDSHFRKVMTYTGRYNFVLFEYLDAKQIISLVDYVNTSSFGKEKEFVWGRDNPDEAIITYNLIDKNDVVLFKEFYHKSWKAKDIETGHKLEIKETDAGFMMVYPELSSRGIVFYQSKTTEEIIGFILSILGILLLVKNRFDWKD